MYIVYAYFPSPPRGRDPRHAPRRYDFLLLLLGLLLFLVWVLGGFRSYTAAIGRQFIARIDGVRKETALAGSGERWQAHGFFASARVENYTSIE